MSDTAYRFGRFTLDMRTRQLVDDSGDTVHLEKQVFDVIAHLIANRDRVISKNELFDEVWGDRFVSESALTSRIKSARQALDDDGRTQGVISTVHGVGYRFVAAVEQIADHGDHAAPGPAAIEPHQRLAPPKAFIGRAADVERVEQLLDEHRMVTIVGPGGVGKTHLLTTIGDRLGPGMGRQPIMLRLAEVMDGEALGPVLLEASGASQQPGTTAIESALRYLANTRSLLLVDNAEHIRRPVSNVARSILQRCPQVTILATSRQRLNVIGERVYPLSPLAPEDAVELFIEHAAGHGTTLDPARADVRLLCERLDGVPLALELAAARTPMLAIGDLHGHLEQHLSMAIDTDDLGRHSSVEAALAWSLAEVSESERRLLSDLTTAVGLFDLEAAAALADDDAAAIGLLSLCERSLVVAEPDATRSRFRLLEPIRLFAGGPAEWQAEARRRHVAYFVGVAEAAGRQLRSTPDVDPAIDELRENWSNFRAAFDYADELDDLTSMSRMVAAVVDIAELRLTLEVERWCERILERRAEPLDLDAELQAEVQAALARLAAHRFDLQLASELVAALPDSSSSMSVMMARIWNAFYHDKGEEVQALLAEALASCTGTGGLNELGVVAIELFRSASAGEDSSSSVDRLIEIGAGGGRTATIFAEIARGSRKWMGALDAGAIEHFERAIALGNELGHAILVATASSYQAVVLASISDAERALVGLRAQLEFGVSVGYWTVVLADLPMIAKVLADVGENAVAARLLGLRDSAGYEAGASQIIAGMMVAVLQEHFGDRLDALMEDGAALTIEEAAELAIAAIDRHLPVQVP